MTILTLSILTILCVLGYFWLAGHVGVWSKFAKAFPLNHTKIKAENYRSIVMLTSAGTGWNATNIKLSDYGISITTEKWFCWALPPFEIPWTEISRVKLKTKYLLKWTELHINTINESVYISNKYFDKCTSYLKNHKKHESV